MFFLILSSQKKKKRVSLRFIGHVGFGYVIKELLESNPDYPNLTSHHTIDDETGKKIYGTT